MKTGCAVGSRRPGEEGPEEQPAPRDQLLSTHLAGLSDLLCQVPESSYCKLQKQTAFS